MSVEQLREIAPSSNPAAAKIRSENFGDAQRRKFFCVVAKFRYPRKTAANVSALTGYPERTIYDWLKGHTIAPWSVFVALFGEIEREPD